MAKAETGGRSVSGLINLLKSMFNWSDDLYQRPYRERGRTLNTKYADLNEIREVRNMLVHQHAQQSEVIKKSNRIKVVEDRPVVEKPYLEWAEVVMSAIAHGIAEDVIAGRVSVRRKEQDDRG
jgi:hypothetical protein